MSIAVKCPHCVRIYSVSNSVTGKKMRCKNCQTVFLIRADRETKRRQQDVPRIFISHCTNDRPFVESEILPVLRAQGVEYWYCKDDIHASTVWEREIVKALESCDSFLLVMSSEAAQSEWVKDEVNFAVAKLVNERLILVLFRPCKVSDFHIRFPRIQYVDYTQNTLIGRQSLDAALGALIGLPPTAAKQGKSAVGVEQRRQLPAIARSRRLLLPICSAVFLLLGIAALTTYIVHHALKNAPRPASDHSDSKDMVKSAAKLTMELTSFPGHDDLESKLNQTVNFEGCNDPKETVDEVLNRLTKRYEVVFEVDERAFRMEGLNDVRNVTVAEGADIPPMKAPLREVLTKILQRIPAISRVRYQSKTKAILITTVPQLCVTIDTALEDIPLREVLDYVEDHFEFKIDVGPEYDTRSVRVAAVRGVPLAVVLERLLNQVGLEYDKEVAYMVVPRQQGVGGSNKQGVGDGGLGGLGGLGGINGNGGNGGKGGINGGIGGKGLGGFHGGNGL